MMNKPFFSILITCFNCKEHIKTTIDCCINQKFQDFEVLLFDNGSNDGTTEIIKNISFDKMTCFFEEKRVNNISMRNFLIDKSNGKYIIWLDSFDKITPFFLYEAFNVLKDKNYDILEFSTIWSHENNKIDIANINNLEIYDNCLNLYFNRTDILQDMFIGKVFNSDLMKSFTIKPFDIYQDEESFYSVLLYLSAKSYKAISDIFVYDYHEELKPYYFNKPNLENIKNICKIKNELLKRNIEILKDYNLYKSYALHCLNKLYLYNLFQDMLYLEKVEERKEAFKEFYKYFTIQLSANILLEN